MLRIRWIIPFAFLFVVVCCNRSDKGQTPSSSQQPSSTSAQQQPMVSNSSQTPTTNVSEVRPKTDACALLTSKEIEVIQGEPLKETKLSERSEGGFLVSQCFFTLPTFTNSISLAITQKGEGTGARDPKEFWTSTFENSGKDDERERESGKGRREEKGEKEKPPKKIAGIGDDAFWTGSRVGGALYVLKGDNYVRVSIGGAGDEASKIKKSKALAQKVIARL